MWFKAINNKKQEHESLIMIIISRSLNFCILNDTSNERRVERERERENEKMSEI